MCDDVKVLLLEAILPKAMFEKKRMIVVDNLVTPCFISFLLNILFFFLTTGSNPTQRVYPNYFSIV